MVNITNKAYEAGGELDKWFTVKRCAKIWVEKKRSAPGFRFVKSEEANGKIELSVRLLVQKWSYYPETHPPISFFQHVQSLIIPCWVLFASSPWAAVAISSWCAVNRPAEGTAAPHHTMAYCSICLLLFVRLGSALLSLAPAVLNDITLNC